MRRDIDWSFWITAIPIGIMAFLLIAAGVLFYLERRDCVKWETDGPPSYIFVGGSGGGVGFGMPVENRHCVEYRHE